MAVAVAAALLVAAHWAMPTQTGLDIGMYLPNTTWHNAPFAARFVQDHQVGALHFTEVLNLTVWFYPQNSELLHSAGVLFLGNDFLSPLINIGWMSLCLLAAWVFARPYGGGPIAVLAIALVLDANMLLLYQPGDAKNDTAGLFFLLASAAVLVNAEAQAGRTARSRPRTARRGSGGPTRRDVRRLSTGALIVAGLAAGLAAGHEAQPPRALRVPDAGRDRGRRRGIPARGRPASGSRARSSPAASGSPGTWSMPGNPLPWIDKPGRCRGPTSSTSTSASRTTSPTTCCRPTAT